MALTTSASDEELMSTFNHLHLDKVPEVQGVNSVGGINTVHAQATAVSTSSSEPSGWVSAIRHSEYTTNRHRRHSLYPFETKKLLQSLQGSTNRCTKSKSRNEERKTAGTTFTLRPSKLILKKTTSSFASSNLGRRIRKQFRKNGLDTIHEDSESDVTLVEPAVPQVQQSCSQQATSNVELNINELASYFDLYLHLPKKMSPMAEMMYT